MTKLINEYAQGPEFGKHITRAEADKYFDQAGKIEERSTVGIEGIFSKDPEALEYFKRTYYGYVFSKETLEALINKMSNDHYLVMLRGAKFEGPGPKGQKTLIAMVYKAKGDSTLELDDTTLSANEDSIGTQHPGLLIEVSDSTKIPGSIDTRQLIP